MQDVLWDDRWTAKRQRFTHPGGLTAQVQGQWLRRSTFGNTLIDNQPRRFVAPFALPDDVWGPPSDPTLTAPRGCRIQFRMVAFQIQYQDREHIELITTNPDGTDVPICDQALRGARFFQMVTKSWEDPSFQADLPVVVFNWTIVPESCASATVDFACSRGGKQAYPYGNTFDPGVCATAEEPLGPKLRKVSNVGNCGGGFQGIGNMSGNVAEWESSCNGWNGIDDVCRERGGYYQQGQEAVRCASDGSNDRGHGSGIRCCADAVTGP